MTTADDLAGYVVVDTAVGGVNRRNHPLPLEQFHPNGTPDCFRTWLRFTEGLATYTATHLSQDTGKPSVGGYPGPGLATFVPLDFDCREEPARALADARTFVRHFVATWGVDPRAVRVFFSGNKGISVEIPATLFGGFDPAPDVADRVKRLVVALTDGLDLPTLDWVIYEKMRLWRCPNTRHGVSRLFKIPLTIDELLA